MGMYLQTKLIPNYYGHHCYRDAVVYVFTVVSDAYFVSIIYINITIIKIQEYFASDIGFGAPWLHEMPNT